MQRIVNALFFGLTIFSLAFAYFVLSAKAQDHHLHRHAQLREFLQTSGACSTTRSCCNKTASGGVSIFGLQLARTMSIQVIITSSSDDKLARAKALGANHGINYKTTPDWEKAALGFTGGRGVDHVVEVGGAATLARSFGATRVGGKISMIGGLSGPATELNPGLIFAPSRQCAGHLRRLDADV